MGRNRSQAIAPPKLSHPARRAGWVLGALAVALISAPPVRAGEGAWTPLGPEGGEVWSLAVDPANGAIVYAGTPNGLLKSTDAGASWRLVTTLPTQIYGIASLAVTPSAVYAGTGARGLFKSTDGGRTWRSPTVGLPSPVSVFLVDPRAPSRMWAGAGYNGVSQSTDGGATWRPRRGGFPNPPSVQSLALDPTGANLYVGTLGGVWRSTDQGGYWRKASLGMNGGPVRGLVVDPQQPARLLAGTARGLFETTDRGGHWRRTATTALPANISTLAFVGSRLYAGTFGNGLSFSDDRGVTWRAATRNPESLFVRAFAGFGADLYAGTAAYLSLGGVFHSVDRGVTWDPVRHGFFALRLSAAASDPSDANLLFAGVANDSLYRSSDAGATWVHKDLGSAFLEVTVSDVLVDPDAPATVYACSRTDNSLFGSDDRGETWTASSVNFLRLERLARDRRTPGGMWAVVGSDGVAHSDDFGASWGKLLLPTGPYFWISALAVDPFLPATLVAGGGFYDARHPGHAYSPRFFRSIDGGQTWQRRESELGGLYVNDVAIDPASSSTYFAATTAGLYRSTDSGAHWALLLGGVPGPVDHVVAAPTSPTAIYVARAGIVVQRSTDGGATWTSLRPGLFRVPIARLVLDAGNPSRLLAATATQGLWEYTEPATPLSP